MARQGSELYQLKGSGTGPCFLPQGEKLCTAAFKVPFNKFLVLKAKRVSECSFSVSYQWTTSLFCTKWQNVCVNIDQDGRQLSHFHLLGVRLLQVSSCLGVHLDWVPYGTWKKWLYSAVNHLQDLSIIRVPAYGMTCLPLCLFLYPLYRLCLRRQCLLKKYLLSSWQK